MSARQDTQELMQKIGTRNVFVSFDDANTLRRAEKVLHRWAELECGDSNDYHSWIIERDEQTNQPFMVTITHRLGVTNRTRIADREAGALRRVKAICERVGLHFYHQTDPRGSALYLHNEPMKDHDYTQGFPV